MRVVERLTEPDGKPKLDSIGDWVMLKYIVLRTSFYTYDSLDIRSSDSEFG